MLTPWESLRLLADPTRARILFLLNKGELAVGELQEILGASRHTFHSFAKPASPTTEEMGKIPITRWHVIFRRE